jgi:hypothetical protein
MALVQKSYRGERTSTTRRHLYSDTVVGLAWSKDPEGYGSGSLASGKVSHARQVKGDDPDKKGTPALQVGGCMRG